MCVLLLLKDISLLTKKHASTWNPLEISSCRLFWIFFARDLRYSPLLKYCTTGRNGISFAELTALNNDIWGKYASVTQDNLQTWMSSFPWNYFLLKMWTIYIGAAFLQSNHPKENYSQWGLPIILSKWRIVFGKTCFFWN